MLAAPRVVYVAGVGFSGSTLLSFLANAHPGLVSVGEVTGPPLSPPQDYACSCGAAIADCAFWRRVGHAMAARGFPFDPLQWDTRIDVGRPALVRHLLVRSLRSNMLDDLRDAVVARLPGIGARIDQLLARNRALIEAILEVSGRAVLVDASKHPIRARFLARAGVDLRVVHLVRDVPGFVDSCRRNLRMKPAAAVRVWNRGAAQVERLRSRLPAEHFVRLRYEDLSRAPSAAIDVLASIAGLPALSGGLNALDEAHVIGNRMRLAFDGAVRPDERWRESLGAAELARVLRATERWRERFGYRRAPGSPHTP